MHPVSAQVQAVISLSDERDQWRARVEQAFREGYAAAVADAVVQSLLRAWPDPRHLTDIERARYGPGGREHFADPRPGDFPGRGVPA